jgi:CBS-domain-containing membrane protein
MKKKLENASPLPTDEEIEDAMGQMEGFVDITPDDFRKIYAIAYERARRHHAPAPGGPIVHTSALMKFIRPISEPAPRVSWREIAWSWIAAFAGIGLVAYLHYGMFAPADAMLIVGSFGASAVLIYGAVRSPLAQPRNFVGGHLVSAISGVTAWQLLSFNPWLAAAVAVATAISFMHFSRTLHPPGGATALIAVIGGESVHALGYGYVLLPVLSGALIMLVVAVIMNNIVNWRRYPEFWL